MKKKIFSTLAVIGLTLFGFSSATSIGGTITDGVVNPPFFSVNPGQEYSLSIDSDGEIIGFAIWFVNGQNCSSYTEGYDDIQMSAEPFDCLGSSCTFTVPYFDEPRSNDYCAWIEYIGGADGLINGSLTIEGDSSSSGGGDSGSSDLGIGVSSFTPIINNLSSSISEFIPYIVYIGVGLLGACIGFVAIKRLLNRLKNKVLNPFRK